MGTKQKGFTLIEIVMVTALIATLSGSLILVINPPEVIKRARETRMRVELREIATAVSLYIGKYGDLPPDTSRDLPTGLVEFLPGGTGWPKGPYPGSVYDWDNWEDVECWNGETGIVQVTLRQVPGYNAGNDYNFYYVMRGTPGVPHCHNQYYEGECVNCGDTAN